MNQDTRKDPRAKVLTMTVRYKSATLDEFIEHHSYDVSRGGMFIKTPSPFPPGTLLKFEVKIADEQRLMQGVGRVVWKREANDSNDSRPAGMGVKFIKIDDESRRTIERLVDARGGDGDNAFDQGNAPRVPVASAPSASVPSAIPSSTAPTKPLEQPPAPAGRSRKATVIGLGAMKPSGTSAGARAVNISSGPPRTVTPSPPQAQEKPAETFFPKTDSRADMPPVEDQTMMKQAKELLADAMRYAGGTAEDVKAAAKASSIPPHVPRPEPHKSVPPRPTAKEVPKTRAPFAEQNEEGEAATTIWRANEAAALLAESMKDSEPPPGQEIHGRITARPPAEAAEPEPRFRDSEPATTPGTSSSEQEPASAGKVAAAPAAVEPAQKLQPEHVEAEAPVSEPPKPSVKAAAAKAAVSVSERPSSRARAAMTEAANESASEGGGGKGVFALLALAAAAGIGFYLTRPPPAAPEPPPEPAPVEAARPAPTPEPTPVATAPEAPPSAAVSAAPADSASAAPPTAPEPPASAEPEKPEPAAAEKPAAKPAPRRVVPRRAPAKKKAEPALSGEESEAPPAEAAPKPPAEAAPEAPPPAPPAPPAPTPPSPTPPPATPPLGDNPY